MTDAGEEIIRVLLVDDHKMVRSGLAMVIKSFDDLELVGEAANGVDGVRLCDQTNPHVVLMDLMMPEMDGVTATKLIREAHPETQIIALTSFKEQDMVKTALQAGAISYLLKDASIHELAAAIRAARDGQPTMAWEATQALIQSSVDSGHVGFDLTARELEVLALLVEALTNRQIAEELGISINTVNVHVSNILSKLGAASRTQAVTMALEHDLLS